MSTKVQSFFDTATSTVTYVIHAGSGTSCAIVDSVLDYDFRSGRTSTTSADAVIAFIKQEKLNVEWLLETHAHADHVSAAPYLQEKPGGVNGIREHIREVQGVFKRIFNLEPEFALNGSQFGHLFTDGERFRIGDLNVRAMHVPGHTPADIAYIIDEAHAFVGDTLFMPDVGSARCDFPGGNAHTLYHSTRRLLSLPPETVLYMCHDYPPANREASWVTTVAEQRAGNIHLHDGVSEDEFVDMRTRRDSTLAMPNLILPSIQINIRAGHLPPADDNGTRYLKIPLNAL